MDREKKLKRSIRVCVVFRKEDAWVRNAVQKIVEHKRLAGLPTSFSYELVRLAKNGILKTSIGAKLDRKILTDDRSP